MTCDKTCLTCSGSNPNECLSCNTGSQLKYVLDEGTFCYLFSERSLGSYSGNSIMKTVEQTFNGLDGHFETGFIFIFGLCIVISVVILLVYRNLMFGNNISSFSYTPVRFYNSFRPEDESGHNNESDTEEDSIWKYKLYHNNFYFNWGLGYFLRGP